MNDGLFKHHAVIITGASAGIGKALALQLARQGARITIAARRAERLEQVAHDCRRSGADVLVIPTDVAEEEQCKALVERSLEKFGRLDMLINNAGLAATALFDEFPNLSLFRHTMDVNFYGSVYCTYYAMPHLKQSSGRIVAISSLGGKVALPFNTPYCASKYGLHGFYDALRMEQRKHGVSVTMICPWWVITEFHEAQLDKEGNPRGTQGRSIYRRGMMTAEQCADITLRAAFRRKREVWMGPGTLAVWLKLLAPGILDWVSVNLFLKSIARRVKAGKIEA